MNEETPASNPEGSNPIIGQDSSAVTSFSGSGMPPVGPPQKNHTFLKIFLIVSLVILILDTGLLLLTFIPFAGIFIALGAAPIFLATGIFGLFDLIVVLVSLSKHHFTGAFKKIEILLLALSGVAILAAVPAPFIMREVHQESDKTQQLHDQVNAAYAEVTLQKATELLNGCQVYGLVYNNGSGNDWEKSPENTSTGILTYYQPTQYGAPSPSGNGWVGGTYVMFIAERMVSKMVPIARQAQHTCGIQFTHDGTNEEWKDGHWYFRGSLVN